jgi:3-oxoacyl-[acyl-carrier-protein] synthase-3
MPLPHTLPALHATTTKATSGRLRGLGLALPATTVSGTELAAPFGRSADWIQARTGIRTLRRLSGTEDLLDLAMVAASSALARGGLDASQLDLVIATSCSNPTGAPPIGSQLVARLGARAGWLDLNSACSGFCYAIGTADAMIRTGTARHVLIVAAERMSALLDPADLGTSIIFGDGAGAALLGPAPTAGTTDIGPIAWGSDGSQAAMIDFDESDKYLRMNGQGVFRWAIETVPHLALRACELAGVSTADIDVVVPHQANLRIIESVVQRAGLSHALIATDVIDCGNSSSASIPIALTRLVDGGLATSGQLALLLGFGAGLAWAGQVVRLP